MVHERFGHFHVKSRISAGTSWKCPGSDCKSSFQSFSSEVPKMNCVKQGEKDPLGSVAFASFELFRIHVAISVCI